MKEQPSPKNMFDMIKDKSAYWVKPERVVDSVTTAVVYVLVSECRKFIKVGYSKALNQRIQSLRNDTPFGFAYVGHRLYDNGGVAYNAEQRLHKRLSRHAAKLTGFNGCTEWVHNNTECRKLLLKVLQVEIAKPSAKEADSSTVQYKKTVEQELYFTTTEKAEELEEVRCTLVQEAQKPEGTESRKRLKQLMTFEATDRVVGSGFSTNVRSIGNKTDAKINSYFRSKFHSPRGVK